jgi:hypothetical protein
MHGKKQYDGGKKWVDHKFYKTMKSIF